MSLSNQCKRRHCFAIRAVSFGSILRRASAVSTASSVRSSAAGSLFVVGSFIGHLLQSLLVPAYYRHLLNKKARPVSSKDCHSFNGSNLISIYHITFLAI